MQPQDSGSSRVSLRAAALTTLAMLAFAGNSLLCRLALGRELLDAGAFATVRVLSGALLLSLLAARLAAASEPEPGTSGRPDPRRSRDSDRDWIAVLALAAYLLCFTYAYRSLAAGTGALLLFGAVQLTMFAAALRSAERLTIVAWLGVALAIAGLCYLVAPGLTAPDPMGAALMVSAGIAWGIYSLRGGRADPLRSTAANFIGAVPIVALVSLFATGMHHFTTQGLLLAVTSGAITSGLGYVVWYAALPLLTRARAAVVQLSVPVIAAAGGVMLLAEPLSVRLVLAALATLGGIGLVVSQRQRVAERPG
jgi:drug/metabolite transporter (DMT)-like permease